MSQPSRNQSLKSANATPHTALLRTADYLVGEFERLLASELHLLKTGQVDGLEAIAEAKQVLVVNIDAQQAELIRLFNEQPHDAQVMKLKDRLIRCRTENRNNHALVVLELKHADRSLELLRSVLKMDDLSLYGESGELRVKREKRKFGSA